MTEDVFVDLSGYKRAKAIITVGSANAIGASTGPDANIIGDLFIDTDVGIMSVWNSTGWDDVGPPNADVALELHRQHRRFDDCFSPVTTDPAYRPCLYCSMLNPPDAAECGAGRWNGCGAPLREGDSE